MATVSLQRVSKTYSSGVEAIRELDLHVADGEFIALVGPSGCGKSTTLRVVAGLEKPTAGRICIGGKNMANVAPKDRDVAMVFQNYALYPHMTVYKNIAFGLSLRKISKAGIDRRVRDVAQRLGVADLLGRTPGELSGGQRQRVALGRAIVRDAKCFLFDEPLSNLDASFRMRLRADLKALHMRTPTTTIYVTHDQEEAMTLGDRIAVMRDGRIHQIAEPLQAYRHPADRFVAGFIGSPAMNFLAGRLIKNHDEIIFDSDAGIQLQPSPTTVEHLQDYINQEVIAGIRPQSLQPAGGDDSTMSNTLALKVILTEPLGDRSDVILEMAREKPNRITARIDAAIEVAPGEQRRFAVSPDALHFFEPGDCGRAILLTK